MKKYSVFVSSPHDSLVEERNTVIQEILDEQNIPICMEHFAVSNFNDIKKLLDISDVVVLLLGGEYGSEDKDGKSWTEREFDYAVKNNIRCVVIKCNSYLEIEKMDEKDLEEGQKKQREFVNNIVKSDRMVDELFVNSADEFGGIDRMVRLLMKSNYLSDCLGWSRPEGNLYQWKKDNEKFNLSGTWYHVHLKDSNEEYIRIGKVEITQNFSPNEFRKLKLSAENNDIILNELKNNNKVISDKSKTSSWSGEYVLNERDLKIEGIFESVRSVTSKYGKKTEVKGERKGVHILKIISDGKDKKLSGNFYNCAPKGGWGELVLFRSKSERDEYLVKQRGRSK